MPWHPVFRDRPSCIADGSGRKRPDNGCGRPGRHGALYLRLEKGSSTVSGQTSATFNKASAVSGDAGVYSCVVTDADGTVITSADHTVTIS